MYTLKTAVSKCGPTTRYPADYWLIDPIWVGVFDNGIQRLYQKYGGFLIKFILQYL
jgi:hypothetical protein